MRLRASIFAIELGKNRRTDEMEKVLWSGMRLSWGVVWVGGEPKVVQRKTCLPAGRAVYVHYFKDIRQGALQSDCVMLG